MASRAQAFIIGVVTLGLMTPQMAMAVDARSLMYSYARASDANALRAMRARGYSFEMMDANGNTPVCEAALRQDKSAINLLVAMGANPQPACWQRLPPQLAQQMTPDLMAAHVGMGTDEVWQGIETDAVVVDQQSPQVAKTATVTKKPVVYAPTTKPIDWSIPSWVGWLGVAGAIGGAAALISSSGSSSHKEGGEASKCDDYTLSLKPVHAYYESCEYNGVVKYRLTGCFSSYILIDDVCMERQCSAYPLETCPAHGTCSDCTELDGTVVKKLDSCASGYQISNNKCVEYKQDAKFGIKGYTNLTEKMLGNYGPYYYSPSDVTVESAIYQDVYGLYDATQENTANNVKTKDISNAFTSSRKTSDTAEETTSTGSQTITITHSNKGSDYGIYSTGAGTNARSLRGKAAITGTIKITKNMSSVTASNMYGIKAQTAVNSLAEDKTKPTTSQTDKNITGDIQLSKKNNKDNTVTVGVSGITYAANAIKTSINNLAAIGKITITHSGSGTIKGVESTTNSTNQGYAYNALMVPNIDNSNIVAKPGDSTETEGVAGTSNGTIAITNSSGNANIVGVDGYARAANAFKDLLSQTAHSGEGYVTGKITISNPDGDGDIFGVRSDGGAAYNMYNNHGSMNSVATIEIENGTRVTKTENGKTVTDTANSKSSDGRVYGMYSQSSASNSIHSVGASAAVTTASSQKKDMIKITGYGTGETWGMYSKSGTLHNEYMLRSADTTTSKEVNRLGQIYIRQYSTGNVVGMQGAIGYNAEAKLNTSNTKTTAEGQIDILGYSQNLTGAIMSSNFYNVKVDRRTDSHTTLSEQEDVITGLIKVMGSTSTTTAKGIVASGDVYNAQATAYASKKATVTGNVQVKGANAVGIQSSANVYNAYSLSDSFVSGKGVTANVTVLGGKTAEGIKAAGYIYNARGKGATGHVEVLKMGYSNGDAYGLHGTGDAYIYNESGTGATESTTSKVATVKVSYSGYGNAYGIYGKDIDSGYASSVEVAGNPIIAAYTPAEEESSDYKYQATGSYYGIYTTHSATVKKGSSVSVTMGYPMYSGTITSTTDNTKNTTKAYGIYGKNGSTITNAGTITVAGAKVESVSGLFDLGPWSFTSTQNKAGTAYGIYTEGNGGKITNSGTVKVSGFNSMYGIYVKNGTNTTVENASGATIEVGAGGYGIYIASNGSSATVTNNGTIKVGTYQCTGSNCTSTNNAIVKVTSSAATASADQFIHLNGATLVNNASYVSEDAVNFDTIDGTMSIGQGGSYEAPSLSGNLFVDNNVIGSGFSDTYTLQNALNTDDSSKLNVKSKSALFVADKTNNGTDIVMKRKSFSLFSDNDSIANFLNQNYALKQNEKLFNALKQINNVAALRKAIYALSGQKLLGQLNFEDISMMRELNARMNQTLFEKDVTSFNLTETPKSMLFKGASNSNVRYGLMNKKMGDKSIGLGIAVSQVINDDGNESDNHQQTTYQMIVPFGFQVHGLKVVTAPRLGYARGSYDRMGFNNTSYEGTIEKRVYGVTNEIRYPIQLADWQFAPALEFNMLGYQQRGHESDKEFSLRIPNQHTLSVEGGVGFYASHAKQMKNGTLNLNAGVTFYHEFADPYTMRLKMNEMQGTFRVTDEKHGMNRAVLKAGFDYQAEKMDVYGDVISELSQGINALTKTGIRIKF